MSRPTTRSELIDYALRALGHPVIEINVDDDQLEDRLDECLQFFSEYHYDGQEKVYLKYRVTQEDINNGYVLMKYDSSEPDRFITSMGASGQAEDAMPMTESGLTGTVPIEDTIISVLKVFQFSAGSINMFDVRYQYALNDLYTFGTIELINYTVTQQYLSLLQQLLSPEKSVRFTRKSNKLYIDTKWSRELHPGDYLIIEAWRSLDARVFPEIYNDMMLKRYLTAVIKRQWAINLSKFKNISLPGGIVFNGDELYRQAIEEIKEIETTMQDKWETPPEFIVG